jgi:hypothetical protein
MMRRIVLVRKNSRKIEEKWGSAHFVTQHTKMALHEPTKQAIQAMLDLQCSKEELEWLNYEHSVMYAWL